MDSIEAAWLTGVFDGEGCIAFAGKNGVQLSLQMTDEDVVRRLASVTGVGTVVGPLKQEQPHHKLQWRWSVCNKRDVSRLLCVMAPLLSDRRRARSLAAATRLSRNTGKKAAACGTASGYSKHKRLGEPVCAPCRAGNNTYHRNLRSRKKAAA